MKFDSRSFFCATQPQGFASLNLNHLLGANQSVTDKFWKVCPTCASVVPCFYSWGRTRVELRIYRVNSLKCSKLLSFSCLTVALGINSKEFLCSKLLYVLLLDWQKVPMKKDRLKSIGISKVQYFAKSLILVKAKASIDFVAIS